MPDKDKLSDMLDNLIDNNPEQAQMDFHNYLQDKMQDIMGTSQEEVPVDEVTTDEE